MNSFIPWIGGKSRLREQIISHFPDNVQRYIEVFGGAGWVLFARDCHTTHEVFNDIDGQLVNLYRCIKHHREELQRELSHALNSRELFFDAIEQLNTRGMTDIQRAAHYYLIIRASYGADRRSFGMVGRNISKTLEHLPEIERRLERVVIENRDFGSILKAYDKSGSLFYLDPPYYAAERHYDATFTVDDHRRLRDLLGRIKGKFVLSYNDCTFVRDLYDGFGIYSVKRSNNLANKVGGGNVYGEIIIKN